MISSSRSTKPLAFIALAASLLLAASAATLKEGSKAPVLTADRWIKGEPVKRFEPGVVYLVEFWATWCGPCVRAIPHLTELQKKHGDKLVVIGVAGAEKPPKNGPDKRFENVKLFVASQGPKMDYRVVFDPSRTSWQDWMTASGRGGIPSTFIVDHTGKIAWIGHPDMADAPLEAIVRKAPGPSKKKKDQGDDAAGGSDDKSKGGGNTDGGKPTG